MQKFVVIGLGNFGLHAAKSLKEYGSEVTGVDISAERLRDAKEFIGTAVTGDAASRSVLEKLHLGECAGVVVGIGDIAANILVTMALKDMGAGHITARASSDGHCRVLERLEIFNIVYPDRDAATRAGKTLSMRNVLDYVPLAGEYVVMNIHPPKSFIGKNIRDLQIGARFQCQILGIKYGQGDKNWKVDAPEWANMKIAPTASDIIPENSVLLFLGKKSDLHKIQELD